MPQINTGIFCCYVSMCTINMFYQVILHVSKIAFCIFATARWNIDVGDQLSLSCAYLDYNYNKELVHAILYYFAIYKN